MNFLTEFKNQLKVLVATSAKSYADTAVVKKNAKIFFRNRDLYDFSSLDVLDLANNKSVKRAAQESIEAYGIGSSSSRKSIGTRAEHLICEKALAKFFGMQQSLLFSGRNQAIYSLLATLVSEQDRIVCDEDMSGILSDVCLLLNCNLEIVDLSKPSKLDQVLQQPIYGRRSFVFADSIAQSSGRRLDLSAISICCQKHSAIFLLDESYACAVLGARGSGAFEYMPSAPALIPISLVPRPFAVIADLGLGIACSGACVCSEADVIQALVANSRTLGSEPAVPACMAAAIKAAVDNCELAFAPRAILEARRKHIARELSNAKQGLILECESYVTIGFKKLSSAFALQESLFAKGFWLEAYPTPAKASQAAYVRICPSVAHSEEVISELLQAISEYFNPVGV